MKSFLILGAAALAQAQGDGGFFPGEPTCAIPCLTSAIMAAGCQLTDLACQCGPTQAAIATNVAGCIIASCTNPADLGSAVNAGEAICSSFLAGQSSGPVQTATATPMPTSASVSGSPDSTADTSSVMTMSPSSSAIATESTSGSSSESVSMSITSQSTHIGTTLTQSTHAESTQANTSQNESTQPGTTPSGTAHGSTAAPSTTHAAGSTSSVASIAAPTGAAATPVKLSAGVLAGIMGVVALL